MRRTIILACLCLTHSLPAASAAAAEPVNFALGRTVAFAPLPNYSLTMAGGTDAVDLTDGKVTTRADLKIWMDRNAVGYSYAGLSQLAVDLGEEREIGEVAIRLLGGSPSAGTSFPVSVELTASNDGISFYRIASYYRWREGDNAKYGVPRDAGVAWIHKLRFEGVNVRARHVGLALYGAALSASDELYMLAGDAGATYAGATSGELCDFSVTSPRLYFHKPVLMFPTNINAPTAVGMIAPAGFTKQVSADIDLPAGVRFTGGQIAGKLMTAVTGTPVGDGFTRYTTSFSPADSKYRGRIYVRYDAPDGEMSKIRYQLRWSGGQTPLVELPIRALTIEPAPQPQRIMAGLGWWYLGDTMTWPDALTAYRTLGFNTLPLFGSVLKFDTAEMATIDQFRAEGFRILNIDSTFHKLVTIGGGRTEMLCHFDDGTTGSQLCPSYRGALYDAELARVADQTIRAKADILSSDIELWSWSGPLDAKKCVRCKADYAGSGAATWEAWQHAKGEEMYGDLAAAMQKRATELSARAPELGVYDFRPGMNYQNFWPFDRLYPELIGNSQVSTYTPLYPYHIGFIGDEVRTDRQRLPKSDVLPWITPGDAGTFPGEMFTWALLECYANGARGVHFWSLRVWDAESLDAHARALRIIAPVEETIVDGELAAGVTATPAMRVSGMRRGGEYFLLIAKDYEPFTGTVTVTLPGAVPSEVVDLEKGAVVASLAEGENAFPLVFNGERARVVHVRPPQSAAGAGGWKME